MASLVVAMVVTVQAGESVVRQGSNDDLEFKVLHSPVTVETSLDEFIPLPSGKRWTVPPPEHFYCDGVTIERIQLKKVVVGQVGGPGFYNALHVSVDLRVRSQENDMAADVEFALIDGERHLHLGKIVDIRVNAGESESEGGTFTISQADRESWLGAGKHPTLRVTMTTRAN